MKTVDSLKLIVERWPRLLALLLFFSLHSSLFVCEAQAQDENAAFYIYQNDGHFDGFFYDEVQKISYSFLDTLGIEHDEIVSQEIVTADSIYRIMLSAIDSVGFVQPKVEFRQNVHDIRAEGIVKYISYNDENAMEIAFYRDTPKEFIPRVGDVLVDFDMENGFSGKVTKVEYNDNWMTYVYYEPLENIKDVFQRFVCVEQFDHDENGNMTRRRVAGMPQLTKGDWTSPNKASANFDFKLLNMNFSGHIPIIATSDLTMSFDLNTHVAMTLKGSYNINLIDPIYISLTFTSDLSFGMGVTLDGKLATIVEAGTDFIPGIPIPAAAPIFELRNIPGLFARGDVHMKFSGSLVNLEGAKVWHKLVFNDDWLPSLTYGRLMGESEAEQTSGIDKVDDYLEFNGFVQAGVHAPLTLGTNRWLSKFFKAEFGTHLYIGPKLSGAIQLNFTDLVKNGASLYSGFKNSCLTLTPLSVDFETKATSKGLLWGEDEFTFGEGSITVIKDYSLYLLPAFGKWKEEVDPKDSLGNVVKGRYASIMCEERSTLFPYSVGIRAYVKSKETGEEGVYNEWWHDKKYGLSPKWMKEQNVLYHPHVNLEWMGIAGEVRLRPIYGIGGMVFEGAPDFVCDDVGMHFKFNKKELTIDPKMDAETEVTMTTNWERVADRTYYNVHLGFDTDIWGVNLYDLVQKQFSTQYTTLCEKKGTDATTGDSEASLRIVNKMPNRDPFRPITSKFEALWMYDGVGDHSYWNKDGALANLTITQEPYTNPRVIHFGAYNNNSNSTPYYVRLMAWEDVVDLPFNGGNISHTWNKQHDDLGSHSTYQYTATITPDEEKGWGYFTISGSYSCQGEDYGKNKDDEIVLIRTKSESGTFSGPIKYDLDTMGGNNPQSGIWILTSEYNSIEMHGNSSHTDYWTDENGDSQSKTYSGSYDGSGAIIVRMTY